METTVRVRGSGFTVLRWNGQPIGLLMGFNDSGQSPVGGGAGRGAGGYNVIHPLDHEYPAEVVTSRALNAGQITATLVEKWNEQVWETLDTDMRGKHTKLDIFREMQRPGRKAITCIRLIRPPHSQTWRQTSYHNCFIVDVDDSDDSRVGDLDKERAIQILYQKRTFETVSAGSVLE